MRIELALIAIVWFFVGWFVHSFVSMARHHQHPGINEGLILGRRS